MDAVELPVLLLVLVALASVCAGQPSEARGKGAAPRYAIVVSQATHDDAGWGRVVRALETKRSARVLHWGSNDDELREKLRDYRPRYVWSESRRHLTG